MQQTQWSPATGGIAACAVGGIILAAVAVSLITDPPGRLLGGVAGVSLLVFAIFSWRARPKLAIKNDALVSRGWFGTKVLPRTEIKLIRITEFRRLARKVRLLEIDTNSGDLIVFTRWDLGTDPLHVLDALTQAGYAGPGSS
ncbi:hypothetical protein AU184_20930 [Mycolicibacterium novocastrense]|uniref:PH domain-containing protein n=1 Tax=Mycolicibacterium novocastrense TaxID=59813 RepID=A0AAW5SPM9_MYCNV|nr:PH domain-containing protein [Mycolicibacterium novocastrense]KUH65254.1 hypothetical protein AU183_20460 [Mycolicibacterium novocastrense]KUH67807.1 hypothetical protein AU184_20930 [Mycolicibacterium novocastrense]KUH68592.1 hypothetical protein AU072_16910 [Mycolicibacterium novocastrense]MCV7025575.1 PH domain-containing protein [Mycolicibacterium novocastrense]